MTEYAPTPFLGLKRPVVNTGQQWKTQDYIVDNFGAIDNAFDGLGTTPGAELTRARARLGSTGGLSLVSTTHALQTGPTGGQNLAMGTAGIQSRNNGLAGTLTLNPNGGQVMAGDDISLGLIRPSSVAASGGTSSINENGSFLFTGVSYVRLTDCFPRNAGTYEAVFHVTSLGVVAGQSCYINSTNGATHRATNAYRRAGFGGSGTWAFAGAVGVSQGFVTPADPPASGFTLRVTAHLAAWASEQSKYEFTLLSDNGSGEYFMGIMLNTVAEADTGMRFGITSGTMTGRGYVRQLGIAE